MAVSRSEDQPEPFLLSGTLKFSFLNTIRFPVTILTYLLKELEKT